MKAYKCDLCGKFHENQQDKEEFMLRVDGTTYEDLCNGCLRQVQPAVWNIRNMPTVKEVQNDTI